MHYAPRAKRSLKVIRDPNSEYKHIWLVYDKDDFSDEDFDSTAFACKSLSNSTVTVHALWSNQCIEYRFLLHYGLLRSDINRDEYYPKLSRYLKCEYHKNSKDIYDKLKPKLKDAIRNAKKMAEQHEDLTPSGSAPGTRVYELFEMLINYIS